MKIALFVNNRLGVQISTWLKAQGEDLAAAVVHPENRRKNGPELMSLLNSSQTVIYSALELKEPDFPEKLQRHGVQLGISVFFGYLLPESVIRAIPRGIVNLHTSFLPYNRGAYPNVWPIVDGTPAGVSLHYVDRGVDTGDLIARLEVPVLPTDTGESLYRRLESAAVELFKKNWPAIRSGQAPREPQDPAAGTLHRVKDTDSLDRIDPEKLYKAKDLINILRARTFSGYSGAYFQAGEKKIYLSLKLSESIHDLSNS